MCFEEKFAQAALKEALFIGGGKRHVTLPRSSCGSLIGSKSDGMCEDGVLIRTEGVQIQNVLRILFEEKEDVLLIGLMTHGSHIRMLIRSSEKFLDESRFCQGTNDEQRSERIHPFFESAPFLWLSRGINVSVWRHATPDYSVVFFFLRFQRFSQKIIV